MIAFPPSPALSACDSLADIDDLDAFLAAQGSLSHFPTPPLKELAAVKTLEILVEEDDGTADEFLPEVQHIARLFCAEASKSKVSIPAEAALIHEMLWRAQLPPEVLALAFNILARYSLSTVPDLISSPVDLLTVSALALAVSFTSDHPTKSSYWSRHVCNSVWTAREIDRSVLHMLDAVGWRLHELSSPLALERAMAKLFPMLGVPDSPTESALLRSQLQGSETESCNVAIACAQAHWLNDQPTPAATPPCSAVIEQLHAHCFLPLL